MKATSKYSEEQILEGCRKGDRLMQKALFDAYAPVFYPVCARYVGWEAGKDVLQDSFITIFEKIGTFRKEGSFEGWMRRIVVNTALMAVRKDKASKDVTSIEETAVPEVRYQDYGIIEQISARELTELISSLNPGMRNVFNLCVLDGYSYREAAEILGIQENSVGSQLSRARALLREMINKRNDV